MITSAYNIITTAFEEGLESNLFFIFYATLMSITGIYITIWIIYGSIKVMKGDESLNSLGYNIGKFVVLSFIIFYLIQPKDNSPLVPIYSALLTTVKETVNKIENKVFKGYIDNVKLAIDSFSDTMSIGTPVLEGVSKELSSKIGETYFNWWNGFSDKNKKDLSKDIVKDLQTKLTAENKKFNDALIKAEADLVSYCKNPTDVSCVNLKKEIEELKKNITANIEKQKDSALLEKQASELLDKFEQLLDKKDKNILSMILYFLGGLVCLLAWLPFFILTTVFLVKFAFQILELGLTFLISVTMLMLSIPIAGAALLYGKWFKDIFSKWFANSVSNFITIPIVMASMLIFIEQFSRISLSSFGVSNTFFVQGDIAEILTMSLLGPDNDVVNLYGLVDQIGGLLKLIIVLWCVNTCVTGVKKFLDDLTGNSFNFTSGAGAMGAGAAMAVGAGTLAATASAGKAAVGAASVLGNTAGSALGAVSKMVGTAGVNSVASGYEQMKQGGAKNIAKGIGKMALGGLGAAVGGTGMIGGALTKGTSGIAKQLAGKAGEVGANAMKKTGSGSVSTVKALDKVTGSHGASAVRKIGGKIAESGAKSGNSAVRDFGKMMAKSGKDAGGKRPEKAKPATGPTK